MVSFGIQYTIFGHLTILFEHRVAPLVCKHGAWAIVKRSHSEIFYCIRPFSVCLHIALVAE